MKLAVIYSRISPSRIAFLKFILEGYDGLAVLSTINKQSGLVSLQYYRKRKAELIAVLNSIKLTII